MFSGAEGLAEANYVWVQCDLCNKWRELPKGHQVGQGFIMKFVRHCPNHVASQVYSTCALTHPDTSLILFSYGVDFRHVFAQAFVIHSSTFRPGLDCITCMVVLPIIMTVITHTSKC